MKDGCIDYPISTNYRKSWSEWEATREIVQNALDTKTEVKMSFLNNILTVEDSGPGIEMSHLLIGETTKDGETSIGKFGEGIKFGLLTLLREGCKVHVESGNIHLHPELIVMFEKKCLRINYFLNGSRFEGTKVTVEGISESYRERFLSLDHVENFKEQILLDQPKGLYIKGIFAKEIETIAGYNLIVERENPISGDIDTSRILDDLGELIYNTSHKGYIETLLEAVRDYPQGDFLEYRAGGWMNWDKIKNPSLWKEVLDKILGSKTCLWTSHMSAVEAVHKGYNPIECRAYFLKGILKTDSEVIRDNSASSFTVYNLENLSFYQRENLRKVLFLIEKTSCSKLDLILKKLQIVDFNDVNTLGTSKYEISFNISHKVIDSLSFTIDTMLHEYIHFSYGYSDLTDGFVYQLSYVNARIIEVLLLGVEKLPPKEFLKGTKFEYRPKEDCSVK